MTQLILIISMISLLLPAVQTVHLKASLKQGEQVSLIGLFGDIVILGNESNELDIQQLFSSQNEPNEAIIDAQLTVLDSVVIFEPDELINQLVSVHYIVKVPTNVTIILNILGGNVDISDIRGKLTISSAGGKIKADNIIADISINTGGGTVILNNTVGNINCNTGGGFIQVNQTKGSLQLLSGGGDIALSSTQGSIRATTLNGSITASGGTGSELLCKTGGGNINADKLTVKKIKLTTNSGNIHFNDIRGTVSCKIGSGNLVAKDVNGRIEIRNLDGNSTIDSLTGSISAEELNGNLSLKNFHPDSAVSHSSTIYCENGNINMDYYGGNTAIEAISQQGKIISKVLHQISDHPVKAVYIAEDEDHEINIETTNGNIIINKGRKRE